jgi:hypothetical protein
MYKNGLSVIEMTFNYAETREIVFRRPHPSRLLSILPTFHDIELVQDCQLYVAFT